MTENRYLYRVRDLDESIIHYHGRSFNLASDVFQSTSGSRVMERLINAEWRDVMVYYAYNHVPPIWSIRDHSPEQEG